MEDKIRTIYEIDMYEENSQLVFRFVGSGFLYNMVRIIAGTLLKWDKATIVPDAMKDILESKNHVIPQGKLRLHKDYIYGVFIYDN